MNNCVYALRSMLKDFPVSVQLDRLKRFRVRKRVMIRRIDRQAFGPELARRYNQVMNSHMAEDNVTTIWTPIEKVEQAVLAWKAGEAKQ